MATNVARVANRAEMDGLIADSFGAREIEALAAALDAAEVAYGHVNDVHGLAAHPHLALSRIATPSGPAEIPVPAARHVGAAETFGPVPGLGAHTAAVRREFCGG